MSRTVTVIEKDTPLERQERRIASGASEMIDALQTIRDQRLYLSGGYSSFEEYCSQRLLIGTTLQRNLLDYKLPPRLLQLDLWQPPAPKASQTDDVDIDRLLSEARASGKGSVVQLAQDRSASIQDRAAEVEKGIKETHLRNCEESLRLAANRAVKMAMELASEKPEAEEIVDAAKVLQLRVKALGDSGDVVAVTERDSSPDVTPAK